MTAADNEGIFCLLIRPTSVSQLLYIRDLIKSLAMLLWPKNM